MKHGTNIHQCARFIRRRLVISITRLRVSPLCYCHCPKNKHWRAQPLPKDRASWHQVPVIVSLTSQYLAELDGTLYVPATDFLTASRSERAAARRFGFYHSRLRFCDQKFDCWTIDLWDRRMSWLIDPATKHLNKTAR